MTPTEAAALLTICAAYDNRKPDADQARAWAMALDGHRFDDCRDAVVAHYRTSREWIMPADVITAVKKVRSGRLEDVALSPPPGMDPDKTGDYARWLETTRRAVADGRDLAESAYQPTRHIRELRSALKSLPPAPPTPPARSADYAARMEAARAELGPPVPMPGELTAEELAALPPDTEPDAPHSPAPFADDEPGSAMREMP